MGLIKYEQEFIEIEVDDIIVNDTIIKQKALFKSLLHKQETTNSLVKIDVLVTSYANDNGVYGEELKGAGFTPYLATFGADNNTIVDAQTGDILLIRTDETDAVWQSKADLHENEVMFQADFFLMMRSTQPIFIGELIKTHIIQANKFGRFK